ncbi:MAG: S41 family peptidase [Trueperaceae bacterium]
MSSTVTRKSWTRSRGSAISYLPDGGRPQPRSAWLRSLLAACLLCLGSLPAAAQEGFAERFDQAWRLVAERYWNLEARALDWDAVGERYRPQALAAADEAEFYALLEEMYQELGDDHSTFVPPVRVEEIRRAYGNLPCLAVLGQSGADTSFGRISFRRYGDVGYLRLPDLASPGVADDTRQAVRSLSDDGVSSLILDLRGNPGGRLVSMMQVAGVFTRGFLWRVLTRWSLPLPYPALGAVETELPLVVLTDGQVNSAAEGLAGALQRQGRALVVGQATAGNVEAVLPFCLRDGSQAWIATGVLAPIGGATWEGQGVVPDLPSEPDQALDVALRHLRER